jgi:hypothetical protein
MELHFLSAYLTMDADHSDRVVLDMNCLCPLKQ